LLGEAQPKASRAHSKMKSGMARRSPLDETQPKASQAHQEPEPGAFKDEVGDVD
jgi:hypothetical protein